MSSGDKDSPIEKLNQAEDHRNRAEQLVEEAKAQAVDEVQTELSFPADVTAEYLEGMDGIEVSIFPEDLPDQIGELDVKRVESPIQVHYFRIDIDLDDGVSSVLQIIESVQAEYEKGAPEEAVIAKAESIDIPTIEAYNELENLKKVGEIYEPANGYYRII